MRPLRFFLLQFEHVLEYRGRNFVWFLEAFLNPIMMLLFWRGAIQKSGGSIGEFTLPTIATFYFLLIVATSLLVVHIEEDVQKRDIKEGGLIKYLLRPVSYYWIKFNEEFSWRLMSAAYGVVALVVFLFFFPDLLRITTSPAAIIVAIVVSFFAYFISFTYKMCLGLMALWVIDAIGLFQVMEVAMILFAGMVVPISLMPPAIAKISLLLPFSYMIYFPVLAFQGKLTGQQIFHVLLMQIFWLVFFVILYKLLWKKGVYKFTAVGQ